jgi:hypothetical protein
VYVVRRPPSSGAFLYTVVLRAGTGIGLAGEASVLASGASYGGTYRTGTGTGTGVGPAGEASGVRNSM